MDRLFIESLGQITEVETGDRWDSNKLKDEICRRTNYYSQKGIGENDIVIILHNNNNRFFADLFSLWMIGACVACLDKVIGKNEFDNIRKKLDVKYVITDKDLPIQLKKSVKRITALDTNEANSYDIKLISKKKNLDSPALILFTSGSTGLPKGVIHSLRTLQTKWFTLQHYVPLDRCNTTLCLLPTHFGHGLICNALYPLVHGKHVVMLPKSDIKNLTNLSKIIDQYQITFMSSVPSIWRIVLRLCPPPEKKTLQQVNIGSAPFGSKLWKAVQKWSGTTQVWNTYGITETGSWLAGPKIGEEFEPEDGLIGYGWGTEIMITNVTDISALSDANKISLPQGEKGYVWLRTPCLMHGYWNQEKDTQEVMQGSWFYTGDVGMIDERGRLILTGRERNEINKGGMKISPEELDIIFEKHPAILEACAFAIDDNIFGQNIGICLVFERERDKPSLSNLKKWSIKNVSDYKIPIIWYDVKTIPKTSRGKIKRDEVADYCKSLKSIQD